MPLPPFFGVPLIALLMIELRSIHRPKRISHPAMIRMLASLTVLLLLYMPPCSNTRLLLNLHAQEVAVQNIRALVPLVLDVTSTFYARWRESFLLTVGWFSLQDHALSDVAMPASPDWVRMDYLVRSWITSAITDELTEVVVKRGTIACPAWLSIESQFHGNRETRALYLDVACRNFTQGDLDIIEYCWKLKSMADALRDLGEPMNVVLMVASRRSGFTSLSFVFAGLQRSSPQGAHHGGLNSGHCPPRCWSGCYNCYSWQRVAAPAFGWVIAALGGARPPVAPTTAPPPTPEQPSNPRGCCPRWCTATCCPTCYSSAAAPPTPQQPSNPRGGKRARRRRSQH